MSGSGLQIEELPYGLARQSVLDELRGNLASPSSSLLHHFLERSRPGLVADWLDAQVILVGYDAAKLVRDKLDVSGDDVMPPLPFERCALELSVNGHHTILLVGRMRSTGADVLEVATRALDGRWRLLCFSWMEGDWKQVVLDKAEASAAEAKRATVDAWLDFALEQLNAVLLCLDLHLFEMQRSEPSKKLNSRRRAAGHIPLFDFHTLNVSPNSHNVVHSESVPAASSVRLHVRRGHTHRFRTRTGLVSRWLPAMWVGNPNLGFVDKHYRLAGGPSWR
jgi:hypothetical protein